MRRVAMVVYALVVYAAFAATFAAFGAFLADLDYVRTIDGPPTAPLSEALPIDLALLLQFGVVHSLLARPGPKRLVTALVSEPGERSTYVLVATLQSALILWQWRAVPDVLWDGPRALWALHLAGIALVFYSSCITNHFELFGLRKPFLALLGRPYTPIPFRETGLYAYVRHPMMTGFMLWLWATPHMTIGHAILAAGFTVYIVVGTAFEERALGPGYADYRRRVGAFTPRVACLRRRAR